jgi:hypothetical protein
MVQGLRSSGRGERERVRERERERERERIRGSILKITQYTS